MRTKPLYLATAVMLALSGAAIAQTTGTRASTSGASVSAATSPAATTTTSTTGTPVAGACSGSGGSSCSASTTSTPSVGASTVTSTSGVNGTVGSTGSATPAVTAQSGSPANVDNVRSTDPAATQPGPFDAGGAFGPAAVPPTTTTNTGTTSELVPGTIGTTQPGTQQNVFVQPPPQPSGVTVLNTPLFDQAAREGRAKDARRRARGEEPRVYGIAPRTDRDLTWQMPDDPIIRY